MPLMSVIAPIAKKATSVEHEDQVADLIVDAFRTAATYPQGVAALSLPLDVLGSTQTSFIAMDSDAFVPPIFGPAPLDLISRLGKMIESAKLPVLLLGMRASDPQTVAAIHTFLKKHPLPVLETFQAAGSISRELKHLFFGRLGLFRNQPGDRLLAKSDLVITVGFDPVEYDTNAWNVDGSKNIVHMDTQGCDFTFYYKPKLELLGAVDATFKELVKVVSPTTELSESKTCATIFEEFGAWKSTDRARPREDSSVVHPLHYIATLQELAKDENVVTCDVGTVYIYMCRYFFSYVPRHFLVSNGQQTLGVALPWAIAASLNQHPTDPSKRKKVISMSGDGGFMFTSMGLCLSYR